MSIIDMLQVVVVLMVRCCCSLIRRNPLSMLGKNCQLMTVELKLFSLEYTCFNATLSSKRLPEIPATIEVCGTAPRARGGATFTAFSPSFLVKPLQELPVKARTTRFCWPIVEGTDHWRKRRLIRLQWWPDGFGCGKDAIF